MSYLCEQHDNMCLVALELSPLIQLHEVYLSDANLSDAACQACSHIVLKGDHRSDVCQLRRQACKTCWQLYASCTCDSLCAEGKGARGEGGRGEGHTCLYLCADPTLNISHISTTLPCLRLHPNPSHHAGEWLYKQ